MKQVILAAVIALAGSFAMADGGDHQQYNPTPNYNPAPAQPCVDGTQKYFYESRANGLDGMVYVLRTCVNGSYYPKSVTKGLGCKEGARMIVTEPRDGFTDRTVTRTYVCRNGKYVRAN